MAQIRISGLDQGREYYVKARVRTTYLDLSDWSIPYKFKTAQDIVAPGAVDNLTFVSEGDSFIAKWDAPKFNEDGSSCGDLSHYRITLEDLDRNIVISDQTVETTYTLDINKNAQRFNGLAGRIEIKVWAVDLTGNESEVASEIAQNPPPARVQNVTAIGSLESVTLNWDLNSETDMSHYEIHVSTEDVGFAPNTSTFRAKVATGTSTLTYSTSSISTLYFKVIAVDTFSQKSEPSEGVSAQPRLNTDFDKTPPGSVSDLAVMQTLAPDNNSAVARVTFSQLDDVDLDGYDIQYRKTGDTTVPWTFARIPSDQSGAEVKPLPLSTSYDFRIRAVDFNANKGDWSAVVVAPGVKKTTLPAAPTDVTVRGGMSNLMVTWNASTDPSMSNWAGTYEVQISKATNFSSPTTIKTSSTLASFINLDQNTVYYVRVRAIDPYENTGAWSTTVNGNTGTVADANASRVIWSETEPVDGKTNDLWIKIPENVQYRFDGTDWIKAQDTELAGEIDNVRQTVDGKNKAWYQTTKPPATNNTQGDLWFDTDNGNKLHVWSTSANDWVSAQDEAIQDALDDAADALQTADGKNTIFYTAPASGVTPREGDTWFDNAVIKVYKNGAWVNASDNLDTAKARQAIQIAGSKNKTYYVAKDSATGMIEGDILFDTADGNKQYRYNGTAWVSVQDAAIAAAEEAAGQAQETADKKNTIYYSTPPTTGVRDGDTWFDGPTIKTYRNGVWTDSSSNLETQQGADAIQVAGSKNKTYYTTFANRPTTDLTEGDLLFDTGDKYKQYRYTNSGWLSVRDGTIADAKAAADAANQAVGGLAGTVGDLTTQVDNKVEVWFQTNQPAVPAAAADRLKMKGDIWINTSTGASNGEVKMYPGTGTVWNVVTDPAAEAAAKAAADLAEKKVQVFGGETVPTNNTTNALQVNDLWIRDSDKRMHRWIGDSWEIAQDKQIAANESKNGDLVINGSGYMEDATNWPGATFYPQDSPEGAHGSFLSAAGGSVISEQIIPINQNKKYMVSVQLKSMNADMSTDGYIGLYPYDAEGLAIRPYNYAYQGGTTTALAEDLRPGDSVVKLVDSANWRGGASRPSSAGHQRTLIFWNYVDKFGKKWPTHTYSRNVYADIYSDGGLDEASHTITLDSPWSGPLTTAGTEVSNGMKGSNYMYLRGHGDLIPNDKWITRSGIIGAPTWTTDQNGRSAHNLEDGLPPGTAGVKLILILNHSVWTPTPSESRTLFANVSISDAAAAYAHATTAIQSANARNRNFYSHLTARWTRLDGYDFINGDTWYQRDSNDSIIGMWEFTDGSWVSKTLNNQVIANLDAGKINAGTINADRIGANSIETSKIVVGGLDASVVIEDGTITTEKVHAEAITASELAAGAVTAHKIKAGEIDASKIVSGGMDGSVVIEEGTITATEIAGKTITGDKIKGNTIDAGHIKAGSITIGAGKPIAPGTVATPSDVSTAKSQAITEAGTAADTKVANAVNPINTKLTGWTKTGTTFIDGGEIYTDSITAGQIAANAIGVSELAANAVTADKIAANSISAQKLVIGMGENFVNDPNFIANLGVNWGTGAGITITSEGLNSSRSLKIVGSTAQQASYNQPEDSIVVEAGAKIRATVRVKSTGTIPANVVGIGLRHKSLTGVVTYPAYMYIPSQAQITAYKSIDLGIVNIPSDGTLTWFVVAQAGYSSRTIWFDNIQIMRAVGTTVIADDAITTGKIYAQAITGAKIAADTITVGNMGPNSVDRTVIKDGEIITSKLAADAVKAGNIDAGAIQAGHIAAGAITIGGETGHIPSGAIADSGEVVPKISSGGRSKVFRDLANYDLTGQSLPGVFLVRTPITFGNYMTQISIKGYQYQAGNSDIDVRANIYAYGPASGPVLHSTGYNSMGAMSVQVTFCITDDEVPKLALLLRANNSAKEWKFPQFNIAEAIIIRSAPDSFGTGWSIEYIEDVDNDPVISGWTKTTPSGNSALDQAENTRVTDGWIATGTTEINGGKIKTDTITAAQIKAGSITIGPNAPIAPGTVAIPSDVSTAKTEAINAAASDATTKANNAKTGAETTAKSYTDTTVAPINTTIGNWKYGNTTYINGGSIYTRTITADKIKANDITANEIKGEAITANELAANSVVSGKIKTDEIEGKHLKTNTALIKALNIQSSLTINAAGGHIKSSNYNANGSAGFYMDQQQLIINQGKIKAAAIELQDSSNLMPPLYASFNANASAYAVAKFWRGSLSGTTKVANDGKFGGGSVQFVITSNTGFVGMGASGTDLNIPIEGGNQYIISFYVSNRSSKVITLQPQLYQTSAITIKGTATSIANSTAWRRYSVVVTAPASMTRAILRFNLTAGATATFKLDGIQVEQKTGAVDTPSNWSPPGYTSIDGESITTGEISSNQTVNTGNGAIAKWSINTQGEARFGDVTVDGQLIVGKSSYSAAQNANTSVKSDNYVAGTEGWAIKGNGDVEFNNGTFRGMLSLEKADLSMKASVSPIKVFSSPSQSTTIDAAHIRGVTYSYNRELKAGTEDTHYPTTPRLDRKGNFFIGPTTDRSVNIQVHDDTAEDAVYLGETPSNVSITALNIGEQTDPASPPADREDQGLSFRAQRTESRNYSYTGGDTGQENVSRILSGVSSTVKLRSPLYPESDDGLDMYPESANVLQSVTDYSVPKKKNLLPSGEAVGWIFNPLMRESVQGATVQPEFGSSINAGDGRMASIAATPFSAAKYVRVAPFSPIKYTSGKRHIASFYVNSEEASSDIYFGVKSGSMVLSPTEPANASLPAATNFYSTNPPGDYWPLTSPNWINQGVSRGVSDIDHFSGGTPGFVNGAINFTASQRIRATGTKGYHFVNGGTVSFWFKPSTTGNTGEANMYHRGTSSSTYKEMWVILNGATNRLQGGIALTGTARHWTSNTTITYGEWHHIAIVMGPSATNRVFQVYINGVQEVNTTHTTLTGGFDKDQFMHLGADRNLTQQFTGQMGDVAHWETALSPQDIAALHSSPRSAWPSDSFTGSQVAVVPPGQKAHRVSFWSDSLSGTSSPAISAIQSGIPAKFNLFAFQLEEAAYKDDVSLSSELRNSKRPTAWSVSNLDVRSSAKISVETKPVVNFLDYVESTKAVLPNQRSGLNIEPPAQITFDVGSRFSDDYAVTEGVFSGDMFTADASYKMSSRGFSYPGSPQPFMPTALDLHYDFTNTALASRPRIGGSGYLFLGLNNQELGGVRYGGDGVVIKDDFAYPNQDPMPSPWQIVGARTARITGNRAYLAYDTTTVDGEKYVYHGHEFQSHNQTASCTVEGTQGIGWRYGYGGPMISINPIKGDRIHLVVLNNNSKNWWLVVYKNNVKTTLRSGTFSGTRTGIPVIKLSRTGNKITGWYNNSQIFTQTFSDTQLPHGGRFAGFAANVGYIDNYIAHRSGADAAANGEIQPYSFNINNGRGLKVITDYEVIDSIPYRVGEVHVLAPGYYTMSITVRAEALGNAQADNFWMDVVDYRDTMGRENRTIQLSNQENQTNGARSGAYITGNATAYIEGRLEFRLFTNDTGTNRINRIEITVVRVA